jgi:hypothetical protein
MSTLNLALCTIFSFLPESSRSTVFAVCKQWRASYKYVNPTTAYCCSVLNGDFVFAHVLFELFREQIVSSTTTRYISCKLNNVQHFAHFASLTPITQVSQTERFGLLRIAIYNFNRVLVEAIENLYFLKNGEETRTFIIDVIRFELFNDVPASIDLEFLKWLLLTRRVYSNIISRIVVAYGEKNNGFRLSQREDLSDFCTFMVDNSFFPIAGLWDANYLTLMFSQRNQRAFDLFCKQLVPEGEQVYSAFLIIAMYIDGNESKMEHLLTLGADAEKRAFLIRDYVQSGYFRAVSTLVSNYHFPTHLVPLNRILSNCLRDNETFVLHWIDFKSQQNCSDDLKKVFAHACRSSCDRIVAKLLDSHFDQCVLGDRFNQHCSPAVAIALLDHPNLTGLQPWMHDMLDSALLNGKEPLANAILNHPNFLQ